MCSRRPRNSKTGHFMSWKEPESLRNVQKWQMPVQSMQNYWLFFLLNMQTFGFLVIVVIPNKKWKQKSNDRKIVTVAHMCQATLPPR